MKTGRKSLLFGVHQFIWHPITVWLAWYSLYGRPTWRESVCIVIHDWGYWFTPNMDGPEGQKHPELGARIAGKLFDPTYYELVLLHSRHYANLVGKEPSKLCWADKLSILYDPKYFYLFRAIISGEIQEYRQNARGWIPINRSHGYWFDWIKIKFLVLAKEKKADAVPYMHNQLIPAVNEKLLIVHKQTVTIVYDKSKIRDLSFRKKQSQMNNWDKWKRRHTHAE